MRDGLFSILSVSGNGWDLGLELKEYERYEFYRR
jgi:hypothetical protein